MLQAGRSTHFDQEDRQQAGKQVDRSGEWLPEVRCKISELQEHEMQCKATSTDQPFGWPKLVTTHHLLILCLPFPLYLVLGTLATVPSLTPGCKNWSPA